MNDYALLAVFVAVFAFIPAYLRAKGAYVFLLLCAGIQLQGFTGDLTAKAITYFSVDQEVLASVFSGILLLLAPALAILLTKKSVKKRKIIFHFIASLAAAVLAFTWFVASSLPASPIETELTERLWDYTGEIVAVGVLSSLVVLWLDRPKPDEEEKKGKKKH